MVAPPAVSIIVPHLDDPAGLSRTIEALARLDGVPFELIVVDNGSAVGQAALETLLARQALPPRLLVEPRRGAAHARNAGAAVATAPNLAFLDCDCVPDRNWLARGAAVLARHPVAGGPVVVDWPADEGAPTPAAAFDFLFGFDVAASFRRHRHLLTSNLWVRREVFAAVGPFRHGVSEDVEWCHRAAALGHPPAFDPALRVSHRALAEAPAQFARWRRITDETFAYHRARGKSLGSWLGYCLLIAGSVPVHGVRVLTDARVPGLRLRARTLCLLAAIRIARARRGLLLALRGQPAATPSDSRAGTSP